MRNLLSSENRKDVKSSINDNGSTRSESSWHEGEQPLTSEKLTANKNKTLIDEEQWNELFGNSEVSSFEGFSDETDKNEEPKAKPRSKQPKVRRKWSKDVNTVLMECYYRSTPVAEDGTPIRGYRRRLHREWKERGIFEETEQRVCDQARAIRKNGWLTELELEEIKRKIAADMEVSEEVETVNISVADVEESMEGINQAGNQQNSNQETINPIVAEVEESVEGINQIGNLQNISQINPRDMDPEDEIPADDQVIIDRILTILNSQEEDFVCDFKKTEQWKLSKETKRVNRVLKYIKTQNITETNRLIKAASRAIAENLNLKVEKRIATRKSNKCKEPWWKRRILGDIDTLSHDVAVLDRERKGELKNRSKFNLLNRKYRIKNKGLKVVLEELKQRILAKKGKIKRYDQRIKQYRQNRLFYVDQRKFYQEINEGTEQERIIPDASESQTFWSNIWSKEVTHNTDAEWLGELKTIGTYPQQQDIVINEEYVWKVSRKMSNWKAPGPDGVKGFWIKKLTSCHKAIAEQLNTMLNGNEDIPEWLTKGRTVLCLKDVAKGNAVDNYRPISCLPLMWKLFTGIISDSMYDYLETSGILPVEQKGCRKNTRGTKDQILIDKTVLKDCKRRRTNLGMAWIDYRKAYDMVPHSWIIECMDMFGIAKNTAICLRKSMSTWKTELTSYGKSLGTVSIKRGIFQGDSLSPLLFVLCMIPLTLILRKAKAGYEFEHKCQKINHLLFMDDLKLYGKDEDQISSLINTVYCFTTDIKMEFGLKKCGVLILKRGKVSNIDSINLPSGDEMKQIEDTGYKYLGILEVDVLMESQMKRIFSQEYLRRTRLILRSKLNGRNKFQAINTWAVALLRYGAGTINWKTDELQKLDRKTRKLLTMHGAFHPKSDVDRLYLKRKDGGRGLISCEHCVISEENSLGFYIKNTTEPLLLEVKRAGIINHENCVDKKEFKEARNKEVEGRWKEKKMYGQFKRDIGRKTDAKGRWKWLQKSDIKPETEALLCAAQEQALRTNYIKNRIDHSIDNDKCRMCGEKGETVWHIISECSKLAQREYKRRHDNVAKMIHWELCGKYGLDRPKTWYEKAPEGVIENERCKILWDVMIQCDHEVLHRKPDIVVLEKNDRKCWIIDIACPGDSRITGKEEEKQENYDNLKWELYRLWDLKKVEIVPIVVGSLGSISTELSNWLKKLDINVKTEHLQKTALLGTARILRRVLSK